MSGDIIDCHNRRGGSCWHLEGRGQDAGILQSTGQSSLGEELSGSSASSSKAEKPCTAPRGGFGSAQSPHSVSSFKLLIIL